MVETLQGEDDEAYRLWKRQEKMGNRGLRRLGCCGKGGYKASVGESVGETETEE